MTETADYLYLGSLVALAVAISPSPSAFTKFAWVIGCVQHELGKAPEQAANRLKEKGVCALIMWVSKVSPLQPLFFLEHPVTEFKRNLL